MSVSQTFKALGDPVRLRLIERLSDGSPYTLGVVTADLGLTRQGVRKHVQVLADAQIISLSPHGRSVMIKLNTVPLNEATVYMDVLERRWEQRLHALKQYVEKSN